MTLYIVNVVDSEGYEGGLESAPYLFESLEKAYGFIEDDYKALSGENEGNVDEQYSSKPKREESPGSVLVALLQLPDHHIQWELFEEEI